MILGMVRGLIKAASPATIGINRQNINQNRSLKMTGGTDVQMVRFQLPGYVTTSETGQL
jgi:hypothetical protein